MCGSLALVVTRKQNHYDKNIG